MKHLRCSVGATGASLSRSFRSGAAPTGLAMVVSLGCVPALAQWLEVQREDRPLTISASGTVESTDKIHIGPPAVIGWRLTIATLVQEGQKISEGQELVRFEGSRQERRVTRLGSELDVKRRELDARKEERTNAAETEKLRLAEARSRAERSARKAAQPAESIPAVEYRKLIEQKTLADALLQQQEERIHLNEKLWNINIELLEVTLRRIEKLHEGAKLQQESYTVRSPKSGIAVIGTSWNGEKLDVGDTVYPGLVVVYVVQDNLLGIEASVYEHLSSRVRAGQRVIIQGDAASGDELIGWIEQADNSVRRESRDSLAMVRGISIRLEKKTGHGLKLGGSVQVAIETDVAEDAFAVPSSAIVYRSGLPGVNLAGGWRQVTLGLAA